MRTKLLTSSIKMSLHKKNTRKTTSVKKRFADNLKSINKYEVEAAKITEDFYVYSTPEWFNTSKTVDVSIVVPCYKSHVVLDQLIKSFPIQNEISWEIIFVDDACPFRTHKFILGYWEKRKPFLINGVGKILVNKTNKGYGQSCNLGAKHASGKYIIFLNADTVVTSKWIEPIIKLLENTSIGIVGNLQIKDSGKRNLIDSCGSEWCSRTQSFVHIGRNIYKRKYISSPYTLENAPKDILAIAEREMVTGCCFGIRKELFEYIGGFNPNYHIGYWEDADICLTVRELGYKVYFTPESKIFHKVSHTKSGGHAYCLHNRNYFHNKWIRSQRLNKLLIPPQNQNNLVINKILLNCTSGKDAVLAATGIVAPLADKYKKAEIVFCTEENEIAVLNRNIKCAAKFKDEILKQYDITYNLDMAHEYRPNTNIDKVYQELVGVNYSSFDLKAKEVSIPEQYIVSDNNIDLSNEEITKIHLENYLQEMDKLVFVIKNALFVVSNDFFIIQIAQILNKKIITMLTTKDSDKYLQNACQNCASIEQARELARSYLCQN
jgi:GT2 family glycosyltransferase